MSDKAAKIETRGGYVDVDVRSGVVTARFLRSALGQTEAPITAGEVIEAMGGLGARLRGVVLDFSRVTFLNSAGLGMCIDLRNRAHALDATATAIGLNEEMQRLFELMKIDRLFEMPGE